MHAEHLSKTQSICKGKNLAFRTFPIPTRSGLIGNMQTARKNKGLDQSAGAVAPAVNVHAIRRTHIERLIAQEGTIAAFAEKVGTNADYISAIISETTGRNAGANLMRKIETAYELRPGSLDSPQDEVMVAAMAMQALSESARVEMLDLIRYKIESTGALTAQEHITPYFNMLTKIIADRKKRGAP